MAQARVVHLDGERRQAAAARARRSGRGASDADGGAGAGTDAQDTAGPPST